MTEPRGPIPHLAEPAPGEDYQAFFGRIISDHCPERGRVLDIGAGPSLHRPLHAVREKAAWVCGIDPTPSVLGNAALDERHQCRFEEWDAKGQVFDLAYAYNVVEHVEDPPAFLGKLPGVLRPGGWFWFLTPNARHPFCIMARLAERLHMKQGIRDARFQPGYGHTVNDYPSYYRMNSPKAIAELAANVATGSFDTQRRYFLHAGFEQYFPRGLRFLPLVYDAAVASWIKSRRLILVCGLRRAEQGTPP